MSDQSRAARYSDLFAEQHDHPSECAYCPICATIAVVRKTKPEVLEHLAVAARELILAAGLLLDEASEAIGNDGSTRPSPEDEGKVRRIDIS
jgi:hypothetical protein